MAYKSIIAMVKPDLTDMVVNSAKAGRRYWSDNHTRFGYRCS